MQIEIWLSGSCNLKKGIQLKHIFQVNYWREDIKETSLQEEKISIKTETKIIEKESKKQ
jgi:hypothetical protein